MNDLNVPRFGHGMIEVENGIYSFGGSNLDSVEELQEDFTWKIMDQLTLPRDNYQFSGIPVDKCLALE